VTAPVQPKFRAPGGNSSSRPSRFTRHAPAWARKSAKFLAFAFVRGTPAGWREAAQMLNVLAPLHARVSLAAAALGSLPEPAARIVCEASLDFRDGAVRAKASEMGVGASHPQPALLSVAEEAADWARFAGPVELRVYAAAIWRLLTPAERRAIAEHDLP
jgi:hypothetical protein